jgi:tetratricopeptide (TPR) repeat protein
VADIFISYTASDRAWAFWVAKELEAIGHAAHVHEREIRAGDDIYAWMEQRHEAADHVLCVLSDAYLKAPYSTLERNAAIWQAAAKRPGFVLFVAVTPCRLPTLADHIRRCELFGMPEDAARVRFREFMQKREAPATVAFPGKVFAASNIPIRVPTHFMGRDETLAAIAAALGRYQGRVAIAALHGLRGVGKTTLAAAYAERHRGDYRATWWIRAQTEPTMRADLVGLGVRLGWITADEKEEPALAAVMERLRHEGDGILLIFDNTIDAAALNAYLPRGGRAHVLVTSNAHAWRGVAEPVQLRLWPSEIGADYLVARTGRSGEREAALALSDALGGLPLAHEQAAAYCEDLDIGLAEYGRRFDTATEDFLDHKDYAPAEYHPEHAAEHRDRLTVASTFRLAIDAAAKRHPAAEPLMVHAALLAPEPIPLFLFAEAREKLGEPLGAALADDGLDKAIAALRTFALVDRETIVDERNPAVVTDCIRLHRLVRQVAAARRDADARETIRHALVEALVSVYPTSFWSDPQLWPHLRRLDPLALALVAEHAVPRGAEAGAAELFSLAGQYRYYPLAAYAQARPLYEQALAMREKALGPEHAKTAESLAYLGHLLVAQGNRAEARPLYERALAVHERASGPEHPDTAASLADLARLLADQGDLAAARKLFERALAIREKALGPEDLGAAMSLVGLAQLLQAQGDLAAARTMFERAQAIYEKVLGPEHPYTATSLSDLARLLRDLGEAAQAEALFLRAVAIGVKALGAEHPLTQRYQSNYASLLLMTDRAAEALRLGQTALATHERVHGPNHSWTRDSARVTVDAYAALGRAEAAEALRQKYGTNAG